MSAIVKFLKTETGGGFLLVAAAALALVIANSPLAAHYFALLSAPLALDLGVWSAELTAKQWVKDGLMAVFFYVVGLELKRELTRGELSNPRALILPVGAALGGALIPALLYLVVAGGADARGWPVPVATDIAFALAALAVLAPKADPRLRIFLLTLAVVDDLIAILLIAILYSSGVSWIALAGAASIPIILWLAHSRVELPLFIYPVAAIGVWAIGLESGVHTSVLAVATALLTPMHSKRGRPVAERLEHLAHPLAAFVVLPVFALSAAGLSLQAFDVSALTAGAPLGVILGLAIGKPIGVVLGYWLATLVAGARPFPLMHVAAIGAICGIGFTMSLFISALAFASDPAAEAAIRLGVIIGSVAALLLAAIAFLVARRQIGRSASVSAPQRS